MQSEGSAAVLQDEGGSTESNNSTDTLGNNSSSLVISSIAEIKRNMTLISLLLQQCEVRKYKNKTQHVPDFPTSTVKS